MDLAELIRTAKGDRSYEQLARDCGGRPTAARLQQIATTIPLKNFPDPPTIRGLASGLRVTQASVVLAAAESLGLDVRVSGSRLAGLLPAGAESLSDGQISAILAVVHAMLHEAEGARATISALPDRDGYAELTGLRAQIRHARTDVADWEDRMPDSEGGRSYLQELRDKVRQLELQEDALSERLNAPGSETSL